MCRSLSAEVFHTSLPVSHVGGFLEPVCGLQSNDIKDSADEDDSAATHQPLQCDT